MALLTPADYPMVRAALDPRLDAGSVSDEVISGDIYRGAAEREVMARDPQWATRSPEQRRALANAAILLTAALLAPVVPQVVGQRLMSRGVTFEQIDWAVRARVLRERAERELAGVVPPAATPRRYPTLFTTARARRGLA